ncbi:hypothetical protein HHL28_00780 [Aerophototrophica crusticola]|uniref:EF-hand domain-containing protein n=1 Tax=Aerophototrophica crusticola TaxID=1709002 RepID=A0A858R362_9PROT|nr:hypothetical protein HHL28_00780 [Rhodospirillaceae bacterium B3]
MMMGRPPLSLAGEPLGRPARDKDAYVESTLDWFGQADRDGDGKLSPAELEADVARFFGSLDADGDGAVNSRELADSRLRLAASFHAPREDAAPSPDGPPRGGPMGRGGMAGGMGADPVMSADLDLDFRVTLAELQAQAGRKLATADRDRDGALSRAEAQAAAEAAFDRPPEGLRRMGGPGGGPPAAGAGVGVAGRRARCDALDLRPAAGHRLGQDPRRSRP